MEISKSFKFEAAHYLPNVPDGHKCGRLHGHSYRVTVTVDAPLNPDTGWVMDFADIAVVADPLIKGLDHRVLNDHIPNPTSENLAVWLWNQLAVPQFPVSAVMVAETDTSSCTYRGES